MNANLKKRLGSAVRFSICVVALALVCSGISLQDRVTLTDKSVLRGHVHDLGDRVVITSAQGVTQTISRDSVAADRHGAPEIHYGLGSVWRGSEKWLLLAALATCLMVPLMQAIRLRFLLSAQRVSMSMRDSVQLAFAGNFLNFAAPFGSTAGDVYKAWYAGRNTPRRTEAATTVFVDRAIGLGTLLLSVGLIAVVSPATNPLAPLRNYLLTLCLLLCGALSLFLAAPIRELPIIKRVLDRMPHHDRLLRADQTARALLGNPGQLLVAVLITLGLQVFAAAAFVCVGLAIGIDIGRAGLPDIYAQFSAGEIIKALPGPPQGLGTVELAYSYFFAGIGSASQILSAAFGIRLVNLLCALPGVAPTLLSRSARRETLSQAQPLAALAA